MLFWKGAGLAGRGEIKASSEVLGQARTELIGAGVKDLAAFLLALEAYTDGLLGFGTEAREKAEQALQLSDFSQANSLAASVLALDGDTAKSTAIMERA